MLNHNAHFRGIRHGMRLVKLILYGGFKIVQIWFDGKVSSHFTGQKTRSEILWLQYIYYLQMYHL